MKKVIFTILLMLATWSARSQANVQFGFNGTTQGHVAIELSMGYNFGPVLLQGGYLNSLTLSPKAGAAINLQVGKRIYLNDTWYAEPAAGYSYNHKSSDNKELNSYSMIYSAGIGRNINQGAILLKASYVNRVAYAGVTFRVNFE